jgi:hypothetical protein
MRVVAVLALLLSWAAALAASVDHEGQAVEQEDTTLSPPGDIALFDLHDPGLMDSWRAFLATTPMLDGALLPPPLQSRLANIVEIYRSLTPDDKPAFFVATYFDLLSKRLLSAPDPTVGGSEILPMQVCPVFVSGTDASVSDLLAVASGLPKELFVHAAGRPDAYRHLFLQTEFSHCKFLETTMAAYQPPRPISAEGDAAMSVANLSFEVGESSYTAILSNKKELRALLETIGDADAITAFKRENATRSSGDEAEVLNFIRLLSLLATNGKSGYAAIPVLLPLVSERTDDESVATPEPLRIADALALAYRTRELFRRIVPFAIRDTHDLQHAKVAVMHAVAADGARATTEQALLQLLDRFVIGSDLLLATSLADEKMPPIND